MPQTSRLQFWNIQNPTRPSFPSSVNQAIPRIPFLFSRLHFWSTSSLFPSPRLLSPPLEMTKHSHNYTYTCRNWLRTKTAACRILEYNTSHSCYERHNQKSYSGDRGMTQSTRYLIFYEKLREPLKIMIPHCGAEQRASEAATLDLAVVLACS